MIAQSNGFPRASELDADSVRLTESRHYATGNPRHPEVLTAQQDSGKPESALAVALAIDGQASTLRILTAEVENAHFPTDDGGLPGRFAG